MPTDWLMGNEPPADWDQGRADNLVGSLVLIGITRLAANGDLIGREQIAGYVRSVDPRWGITVRPMDGDQEDYNMPPMLDAFEPARPGRYVTENGVAVEDPDFLAVWTVTAPQN